MLEGFEIHLRLVVSGELARCREGIPDLSTIEDMPSEIVDVIAQAVDINVVALRSCKSIYKDSPNFLSGGKPKPIIMNGHLDARFEAFIKDADPVAGEYQNP